MIFEHKKERLASKEMYRKRIGINALFSVLALAFSLGLGIVGYHITIPQFDWYDSLLNASMILSGMGPVFDPNITLSNSAKLFASFYALFSGITFLSTFGILIAPILHRFFHRLHLESQS